MSPGVTTGPNVEPDPLQAEILADGRVTLSEMERALLAVVSCVKAEGFDAELTTFDITSGHTFSVLSPNGDDAAADRALTSCEQTMLSGLMAPFVRDNGPSQSEIARRNRQILACLKKAGYDVNGLDVAEASSRVDALAFATCDAASS